MTDNPVSAEQRVTDEMVEAAARALERAKWPEWDDETFEIWWNNHDFNMRVQRWKFFEGTLKQRVFWEARTALTAAPASDELERLRKMEAASESTYKHWRDRALKAEEALASAGAELDRAMIVEAVNAKLLKINQEAHGEDRSNWRFLRTNEIVDLVIALSPIGVSASAEPVAWQYRYRPKGTHEWSDWADGKKPNFRGASYDAEERPLYAAPPSAGEREKAQVTELHIVFADDGGPANLRLVEVETIDGLSVEAGTWLDRSDGLKALALSVHKADIRRA